MKKPIIGITLDPHNGRKVALGRAYINAVAAAGGVPLPLPLPNKETLAADYAAIVDGVLFSGGGDIHSARFGQPLHEKAAGISEERDSFELKLLQLCRENNTPVMGICRGVQLLNVALGGSLRQHIDGHDQHDVPSAAVHDVSVTPGTRLHAWLGEDSLRVNSRHHQAVDILGDGLIATARAPDGVIEALEYGGSWLCFGVQWHPEDLLESPEHHAMLRLFTAFINQCAHQPKF